MYNVGINNPFLLLKIFYRRVERLYKLCTVNYIGSVEQYCLIEIHYTRTISYVTSVLEREKIAHIGAQSYIPF